jgi:diphthamide synthase (EF-2-diphthine--ammonia ligase)
VYKLYLAKKTYKRGLIDMHTTGEYGEYQTSMSFTQCLSNLSEGFSNLLDKINELAKKICTMVKKNSKALYRRVKVKVADFVEITESNFRAAVASAPEKFNAFCSKVKERFAEAKCQIEKQMEENVRPFLAKIGKELSTQAQIISSKAYELWKFISQHVRQAGHQVMESIRYVWDHSKIERINTEVRSGIRFVICRCSVTFEFNRSQYRY